MNGSSATLISLCRVERGLYLLRYVEAASKPYPRADIAVMAGRLDTISAPGRDGSTLFAPKEALILVAEGQGEFEIRVSGVDGGGTDAKFLIDLLDAGTAASATPAVDGVSQPPRKGRPGAMPTPPSADSLCVLAHVSRRGDLAVGADAWVAGPDEVLPVEGLAIATGRDDLGIRIRVRSAQGGPEWSRWHDAGEFAGSRQRADPLTGLGLEVIGAAASQFEIRAEVMTLGSPPVIRTGRTVEFSGLDPIVGFRFGLSAARVSETLTTQRQAPSVRVFRAKR